ncbi:GntR family transcriptional regulator [Amylibacter marinus]|uniref:GntR family transcriptional regulator n=2 Tax=Amylibacter marinus TaxID=1475483 RepID=A0ABQ5VUS2_9RHOB|nr:GntR family transcriptional regulator [Amylibacter marinus]
MDQLRSNELKVGERLPTEKQIAQTFKVSRSTVQAVMTRLALEGAVRRQAGQGTFASRLDDDMMVRVDLDIHNIQSFESEMAVSGDHVTYKLISFSRGKVPAMVAGKLGIENGTEVNTLERLRLVSGDCIGSEVRYFSPEIILNVSAHDLETQGGHDLIEQGLGLKIKRIDAALRAVKASEDQADQMGISVGAPLLVRSHTLYSEDDKIILHGESYYVEPFSFRYTATVRST